MVGEAKGLAHVWEIEARLCLMLETPRQLAAYEKAFVISVLEGKFRECCEVDALEGIAPQFLLPLLQELRQFAVALNLLVTVTHGFMFVE